MKKGMVFVAVALLAFAAGDRLFGLLADGALRRSGFRLAKLYTGRLTGDVLVFGNSRAVNGFSAPRLTELTGSRWVNVGYNGLGPQLVEALVLDALERSRAPRAVVLEVSNLTQGSDGIRDCRLFDRQSKRLAALDRRQNGALGVLAAHCRTFSANGETLLRSLYYLGRSDQGWVNGGQMDVRNAKRLKDEAGRRLAGAAIGTSLEATRRLVQALRGRGIEVWCVVTPYLLNERDRWHAQAWLDAVCDGEDDGVHVVNLVGAIGDPHLYADPSHLNRAGSLAFAEILARDVFGSGRLSGTAAGR